MDLNRPPAEMANAAAESIRELNHRTLDPKAFTQPGDVSDIANAIALLVQRLPQAIQQLEAGLAALHERGAIRLDDIPEGHASRKDVQDRVFEALFGLRESRDDLRRAHEYLTRATGPLSHMGGLWEDEGGA